MLIKLMVFTFVLLIAGGFGYGTGYITYEPQVESLRGTQQELEQELVSVKSMAAQRRLLREATLGSLATPGGRPTRFEFDGENPGRPVRAGSANRLQWSQATGSMPVDL